VALVALDRLADWCAARGIEVDSITDAVTNGKVRLEVARSIGAGNATLSRVDR